jgi:hypothetical protein
MPKNREDNNMPTVDCNYTDCRNHGIEICISRRIRIKDGKATCYEPRIGKNMLSQSFNSNCHKEGGKYKSSRITKVFK